MIPLFHQRDIPFSMIHLRYCIIETLEEECIAFNTYNALSTIQSKVGDDFYTLGMLEDYSYTKMKSPK